MNAKELLKVLAENNILSVSFDEEKNRMYVEDAESYAGYAYIQLDENGNAVKVEK